MQVSVEHIVRFDFGLEAPVVLIHVGETGDTRKSDPARSTRRRENSQALDPLIDALEGRTPVEMIVAGRVQDVSRAIAAIEVAGAT